MKFVAFIKEQFGHFFSKPGSKKIMAKKALIAITVGSLIVIGFQNCAQKFEATIEEPSGSVISADCEKSGTCSKVCSSEVTYEPVSCADKITNSMVAYQTRTCSSDGKKFDLGPCNVESCKADYNLIGGACVPNACVPNANLGKVACLNEIPHSSQAFKSKTCNAQGTDYIYGTCSLSSCEPQYNVTGNACVAQSCTPNQSYGSVSCIALIPNAAVATQTKTCNSTGTDFTYGPCGLSSCQKGYNPVGSVCVPQTCSPNQDMPSVSCTSEITYSASATKTKKCNPAGTGYTYGSCTLTACQDGYIQSGNSCVVKACSPNQTFPAVDCRSEFPFSREATRTKTCNSAGTDFLYGTCELKTCNPLHTLTNNACVSVLAKPTNLAAAPYFLRQPALVDLSWKPISITLPTGCYSLNYLIQRSQADGPYVAVSGNTLATKPNTAEARYYYDGFNVPLTPNANYKYKVAAQAMCVDAAGAYTSESPFTDPVSVYVPPITPGTPPENFKATVIGPTSVKLTWTPINIPNCPATYHVRVNAGQGLTDLPGFEGGDSYIVNNLTQAGTYEFSLTASFACNQTWGLPAKDLVQTPLAQYSTEKVRLLTSSWTQTCVSLLSGPMLCGGYNQSGQLGDGTNTENTFVAVTGISNPTAIGTSGWHACAIVSGGVLKCWGRNESGQLGNGNYVNSSTPIQVPGIENAVALGLGFNHTCVVISSGQVKCWGSNPFGQTGASRGANPSLVEGISDAVAVVGGEFHTCILLKSGQVKCLGRGIGGQLGNGTTGNSNVPVEVIGITDAVSISAGQAHTCVTLTSGGIKCWGSNNVGQLGIGNTDNQSTPTLVSGITNASSVACSSGFTCAVLTTGKGKCWGSNVSGEFGAKDRISSTTPVDHTMVTENIAQFALSVGSGCARLGDGGLKCWPNRTFSIPVKYFGW